LSCQHRRHDRTVQIAVILWNHASLYLKAWKCKTFSKRCDYHINESIDRSQMANDRLVYYSLQAGNFDHTVASRSSSLISRSTWCCSQRTLWIQCIDMMFMIKLILLVFEYFPNKAVWLLVFASVSLQSCNENRWCCVVELHCGQCGVTGNLPPRKSSPTGDVLILLRSDIKYCYSRIWKCSNSYNMRFDVVSMICST
jgi:hypothetical protein